MIYEALTAGCAVGLVGLDTGGKTEGRLVRGIRKLEQDGLVRKLPALAGGESLRVVEPGLNEAERVACLLLR